MNASGPIDPIPDQETARHLGPVAPDEPVEVTLRLRPKASVDPNRLAAQAKLPVAQRQYLTRDEFATSHGADPADMAKVEAFARSQGLHVEGSHADLRTVVLSGPAEKVAKVFGTSLGQFETDQEKFRAPTTEVAIPAELSQIVQAVIGLDNRTHAHPHDGPS